MKVSLSFHSIPKQVLGDGHRIDGQYSLMGLLIGMSNMISSEDLKFMQHGQVMEPMHRGDPENPVIIFL